MRQQKIRGHKKRHQQIEQWRLENLDLRLEIIKEYHYDHADIVVHPYCDISLYRKFPEPKGKTKQLILNGLIDIYHSWKKQLNKIDEPYYLKIWLCEPRFSKSQVVCAIGDRVNYYEDLFFKPNCDKKLETNDFGALKSKLDNIKWEYFLDEDHFENDWVGERGLYLTIKDFEETKKWFAKLLKKPHRTTKLGDNTELYSFKKGDRWLGA